MTNGSIAGMVNALGPDSPSLPAPTLTLTMVASGAISTT